MRQRVAQIAFSLRHQRLTRKIDHVHNSTAENHRIRVKQVDAGGDGARRVVEQGNDKRLLSSKGKQLANLIRFLAGVVPAFQGNSRAHRLQATGVPAAAGEVHIALRDMAQFAGNAVSAGPWRAVQPDGKAHAGAKIGAEHLLVLQVILRDVERELQVYIPSKLDRAADSILQLGRQLVQFLRGKRQIRRGDNRTLVFAHQRREPHHHAATAGVKAA
ncbi:hypothetical protein BBAD15_g3515 [Beauveria bassiana D1-5]|uniref:Uncharacterized protein n=1 Tax=Beauveria bassiana D1-5 TaxID=1245745 RepID=A0A0A2VXM6_BEABA|nr:hypothetical protein BBAD15_g3515 [Beauveria bassiana D1-5]